MFPLIELQVQNKKTFSPGGRPLIDKEEALAFFCVTFITNVTGICNTSALFILYTYAVYFLPWFMIHVLQWYTSFCF